MYSLNLNNRKVNHCRNCLELAKSEGYLYNIWGLQQRGLQYTVNPIYFEPFNFAAIQFC